jgi:hypothetical protein
VNDKWYISFLKSILAKFEKQEKTVSIIIQGPLKKRSIQTIPDYLRYGQVIVSCWENNDLSMLDDHINDITLVVNKYTDLTNCYKNPGPQAPWIYQHHTTLSGLKFATGYSCIKVRSDESYPDLDALIKKLSSNRSCRKTEKKIITSNIYFRFDREIKFHPSDHIVAGPTYRMKSCFERAKLISSKKTEIEFAEQVLARGVIETSNLPISKKLKTLNGKNSKEIMKEHFDIIRIRDLKKHIWTSSFRKYDPLYSEEIWCNDISEI